MADTPGWKPGDKIRVLVFGTPKIGKTFGAGTWPRPNILDYDRGIQTVFAPPFIKKHGYRKVVWKEFYERSFQGPIVSAHNAYDDSCRYFDEMMLPKNRDTFDTWVVDSGTTLSEDAQNKAVILLGTKEYNYQSQTHKQALQHKLLVPKIQDYGAERSLVEQFIDMVASTDKNFVLICHEYEATDEKGNVVGVLPLLTGKSRQAVPLKFSELYWLRMARRGEDWVTLCLTESDGIHLAGSRTGVTGEIEWTYDAVLDAMTKAYDERVKLIAAAEKAADAARPTAA